MRPAERLPDADRLVLERPVPDRAVLEGPVLEQPAAAEALVRDMVWEDTGAKAREPLDSAVRSLTVARGGRLGGDVWSVASRGHESLILLADARGSGEQAAPVARALLAVFRTLTKQSAAWDLARMGQTLDDTVRQVGTEEDFATALLLHATSRGTCQLLTCGHPAPVLLSHGTVRHLAVLPSLPLGLGSSPLVVQQELLGPHERLLLYTDGLTDGADRRGAFRVEDQLDALLCDDLDVALDALLGRVMQHTGGVVDDDLTAMLLRRRSRSRTAGPGCDVGVPEQVAR